MSPFFIFLAFVSTKTPIFVDRSHFSPVVSMKTPIPVDRTAVSTKTLVSMERSLPLWRELPTGIIPQE